MEIARIAAGAVVLLAAAYLLAFGLLAALAPSRTSAYLRSFASSLRVHVLELLARMVVGAAFVAHAPHMHFGPAFRAFGWIVLVTTAALAVLPWRWHQRFARATVPEAERWLPLIALSSIAAAALVLWAAARGP